MELNKFLGLKLPQDIRLAIDNLGLQPRRRITFDEFKEHVERYGWPKYASVGVEKKMYEYQKDQLARKTPLAGEIRNIKESFGILATFKQYVAEYGWPKSKMNGKVLNEEQKIERSMWLFQSEVLSGKRYAGKPEYKKELKKIRKAVKQIWI